MKNIRIFLKGIDKTSSILKFERYGEKIKIFFKDGKSFIYNSYNVRFKNESKEDKEVAYRFQYFKELARYIGLESQNEQGQKINILSNNYSKIDSISNETILYNFLNGNCLKKMRRKNQTKGFSEISLD